MGFFTKAACLLLAAALHATLATPVAATNTTCFDAYQGFRNNSDPARVYALHMTVQSANPLLNGRNVQLRPSVNNTYIAVIDNVSPVLAFMLNHSTIYSMDRDAQGNIYKAGPIAGLFNISSNATSGASLRELVFQNETNSAVDEAFKETKHNWNLQSAGAGLYDIYQYIRINLLVNGFIACNKTDYVQFYYSDYYQTPVNYTGCEYLGLQVRLPVHYRRR